MRGRSLTIFAIGILCLDGALLVFAGSHAGRSGLVAGGMVCLLAALLVWFFWRRYRRTLHEVHEARQNLQREARRILSLTRDGPP